MIIKNTETLAAVYIYIYRPFSKEYQEWNPKKKQNCVA